MKILVDKARFEELEAENVRLKDDAEALSKSNVALDKRIEALKLEQDRQAVNYKNHLDTLEKDLKKFAESNDKLRRNRDDLQEALNISCEYKNALRKERDALLARVRELEATQTDFEEATRKQLDQARDHFHKQAEKMLLEIGDLEKKSKALSARNAELLAEVSSLEKRLSDKKVELARVVAISNQFARERDSYREQYELYQHEYTLRGEVIKKLRKRLHKLKKKLKH